MCQAHYVCHEGVGFQLLMSCKTGWLQWPKTLILILHVQKTETAPVNQHGVARGRLWWCHPNCTVFYYRQKLQFPFTSLSQSWFTPMTSNPEWAFLYNMILLPVNRIREAHVHHAVQMGFDNRVQNTHRNASFFEGTPTDGRRAAGWGRCTHSYFHGCPRWLSTGSGIWVSVMKTSRNIQN